MSRRDSGIIRGVWIWRVRWWGGGLRLEVGLHRRGDPEQQRRHEPHDVRHHKPRSVPEQRPPVAGRTVQQRDERQVRGPDGDRPDGVPELVEQPDDTAAERSADARGDERPAQGSVTP